MEAQIVEDKKITRFDRSISFLVFLNLATVAYAIYARENLGAIMLIYWSQSVSIGIINFIRILQLKDFFTENVRINGQLIEPTKDVEKFVTFNFIRMFQSKNYSIENLKINNRAVKSTEKTKNFVAFFFLFHYGFFHFGYFIFLYTQYLKKGLIDSQTVWFIIIGSLMFFANHFYSYFYNREADRKKRPNIGRLMFFPYARIIPMHLTIIIGSDIKAIALPLFLLLKTGADAVMHYWEHK